MFRLGHQHLGDHFARVVDFEQLLPGRHHRVGQILRRLRDDLALDAGAHHGQLEQRLHALHLARGAFDHRRARLALVLGVAEREARLLQLVLQIAVGEA